MLISPRAYCRETGVCVSNNFSKEKTAGHVSRTENLRGLPNVHLYYLLWAWHLLVAEKGVFVLSIPVNLCDLAVGNLTVTADLQLQEGVVYRHNL